MGVSGKQELQNCVLAATRRAKNVVGRRGSVHPRGSGTCGTVRGSAVIWAGKDVWRPSGVSSAKSEAKWVRGSGLCQDEF